MDLTEAIAARQRELQELGMQGGSPVFFSAETLLFWLGCALVLIGLLPGVLHFFRRFPEPGPLTRFVLVTALGWGLLAPLAADTSGGRTWFLTVLMALSATVHGLLLMVELARRHWEDLKVLVLLPLLPLAVALVAVPFVMPAVAAILVIWWGENAWKRFYLFRSGYRLAYGIRPQPVIAPQGMAASCQEWKTESEQRKAKSEPSLSPQSSVLSPSESAKRLEAPVETEEVHDHERARA